MAQHPHAGGLGTLLWYYQYTDSRVTISPTVEFTYNAHEDIMGSASYYTKQTGAVYEEHIYDAWGGVRWSTGYGVNDGKTLVIEPNYTGHSYDPILKIYHAEARFYDGKTRQWMASDPIKSGLNWYQYVESNPTNYVDPDGLRKMMVEGGGDATAAAIGNNALGLLADVLGKYSDVLEGEQSQQDFTRGILASVMVNVGSAVQVNMTMIASIQDAVLQTDVTDDVWNSLGGNVKDVENYLRDISTSDAAYYLGKSVGDIVSIAIGAGVTTKGILDILAGVSIGGGGTVGSGGTLAIPSIIAGVSTVVAGIAETGVGLQIGLAGATNFRGNWDQFNYFKKIECPANNGLAAPKLKWGNSKSKPTYGHTFTEHGQKQTPTQLTDRARRLKHQVGQWRDDQKAADFLADIAKKGEGVYEVKLPSNLNGRSYLADGTVVTADMARVVVKADGSIRTAFPFSSLFK